MFYTISQHVCVCVCVCVCMCVCRVRACVCVSAKVLVESIYKPECVISLLFRVLFMIQPTR